MPPQNSRSCEDRRGARDRNQPRGTVRQPLRADEHAGRLAAFDHPLQPQPGRERQPPERVRRRVGDVEGDQAERARLQDERQRFHRVLERALIRIAAQARIRHDVAADPRAPGEIEAGRSRGRHVEPIGRVDQRDELAARRRCAHHPQDRTRAARRSRPDELGQLSAREPPPSRASNAVTPDGAMAYSSVGSSGASVPW